MSQRNRAKVERDAEKVRKYLDGEAEKPVMSMHRFNRAVACLNAQQRAASKSQPVVGQADVQAVIPSTRGTIRGMFVATA